MCKIAGMIRELEYEVFTPHPPINRSPLPPGGRLFSPSQALCTSSPKGRAKDVGAYRRAEHAPSFAVKTGVGYKEKTSDSRGLKVIHDTFLFY